MKRSERHHLKENEVAQSVARLRGVWKHHARGAVVGLIVLAVAAAAATAYFVWREQMNRRASALLADAMATAGARVVPPAPPAAPAEGSSSATPAAPSTPPPGTYPSERARLEATLTKYLAAANAHPSTPAGTAARYHAASTSMSLGNAGEAAKLYQEVIDRASDDVYGKMARLGLADARIRSGQIDQAITEYKRLSSDSRSDLPLDAVLMQLGRLYVAAGKPADASRAFTRIVDEFPQSSYLTEAKRELETLKGPKAG